ncbi:MAG: hypothetical protein O2787_09600 [Cyanobacteria bacterium]|nr:hypothetical protein [Cyanobacteriota bacterium]
MWVSRLESDYSAELSQINQLDKPMISTFSSAGKLLNSRMLAGILLTANCLGAASLSFVNIAPARGQTEAQVPFSALRALNLARNTAVQSNGGLGRYRPEKCMFEIENDGNKCLISTTSAGYLFRFRGGSPGWQQLNLAASVETEIRISSDGRTVLGIDYNGTPR